jgi:hypothetical protein
MMSERIDNRSLGDLFAELSRETGQLVRKEVELATTEMTAKAKRAGGHLGMAAIGGALTHAGVLVLLAALVLALSDMGVQPWVSALFVGVVTVVVGYVLVSKALSALRATSVTPTRAIESMKEDARWTTRQGA